MITYIFDKARTSEPPHNGQTHWDAILESFRPQAYTERCLSILVHTIFWERRFLGQKLSRQNSWPLALAAFPPPTSRYTPLNQAHFTNYF